MNDRSDNDQLDEVLQGMIAWRKTERDLHQIATDPTHLPGFADLPEAVQELATIDPASFWVLWQLAQEGFDLKAIDELNQRLDEALREAGWDGVAPPSDAQFEQAERSVRQWADRQLQ